MSARGAAGDSPANARRRRAASFIIFAETGSATTALEVQELRRGIYRAATYTASTDFRPSFTPADAVANADPSRIALDWSRRAW